MTLTFPTIAHQVHKKWRENLFSNRSLSSYAKDRKAVVTREGKVTIYTFEDDTSIHVVGRGLHHKVTEYLP